MLQIYDQAIQNRTRIEQEAIDFIRHLDRDILHKHLSVEEFKHVCAVYTHLTFDSRFQKILIDLLDKMKLDLYEMNKTIRFQDHQSIINKFASNTQSSLMGNSARSVR